ncbi:MAG: hypothetical protein HYR74_05105 [Candidatus Eisenbacteria bacterium]|nr:hypothetical protein [Candidatus Eisenbacteria bacterium]
MNTTQQSTQGAPSRAPEPSTESSASRRAARRVMRSAVGLGLALLAVPVAVTLAVFGCGGDHPGDKVAENSDRHVVAAPVPARTPAVAASQTASPDPAGVGLIGSGEAQGPDVTASVPDTTLQPGRSVEVTAVATGDVRQVVLWDGLHDRQSFAYDSTSGSWHATYRMPIKTKERVALSVTAFNDRDRWRRVWVFLGGPKAETVTTPQSGVKP